MLRLTPLAYDNAAALHAQAQFLYRLLEDRPAEASISHKELPPFFMHEAFIQSRPYEAWYIIEHCMANPDSAGNFDWIPIGSIYLTRPGPKMYGDEIGIFLAKDHQGKGNGGKAIRLLMEKHSRPRYFANINPDNTVSRDFFRGQGFRPLQMVYVKEGR